MLLKLEHHGDDSLDAAETHDSFETFRALAHDNATQICDTPSHVETNHPDVQSIRFPYRSQGKCRSKYLDLVGHDA